MMSEFSRKLFTETLNSARVELGVLSFLGSDPLRALHLQKSVNEIEEILSSSFTAVEEDSQGDHTALASDWAPDESYF